MDINDFRALLTVVGLLCFLAIVGWAYAKGSKKGFDEAANLPFVASEEQPPSDAESISKSKTS